MTCSVSSCTRPTRARGYCASHYHSWRRRNHKLFDGTDAVAEMAARVLANSRSMPNGCVEWQGQVGNSGYGEMNYNQKRRRVHRIICLAYHGLRDEQLVRHTCDNRICVNPDHLLAGSPQDNSDDAVKRNRLQHGVAHFRAKLTDESVKQMRQAYAHGVTIGVLSARYGVARSTVRPAVLRQTWKHVE